jgi:uncharacterized protein (TIGR02452 family)
MASHVQPGGGVERGSAAQEENLFRHTNLSVSMQECHYPLGNHDFLYTQNAKVIRTNEGVPLEKPFCVDVVSIAAPYNPEEQYKDNKKKYEDLIAEKIEAMLTAPLFFGATYLVLGAWGCGAFKNDPEFMADAFYEQLMKFKGQYDNITFGIINDRNSVGDNFSIFKKKLHGI